MAVRKQRFSLFLVCLMGAGSVAVPAGACTVPVFRYALERWEPHVYGVLVFHREALSEAEQKTVARLTQCAANEDLPCNMDVRAVDVSGKMSKHIAEIYKTQQGQALPRMVVCYPRRFGPAAVAWSGPVTDEAARALVDSPIRRKIAETIVKGGTAVWVLVDGGDRKKDDATAKRLAEQLAKMEKELELPLQPAPYPGEEADDTTGGLPLKIAFSLVRLSRQSPGEEIFAKLLLNTEEDLVTEYASEPKAFAVFGQGRAMWALVGKGITDENIADVCAFLVGQCSCQAKDLNPGVDMLFAADWYAGLEGRTPATAVLPDVIAPAAAPTSAPAGGGPVADRTVGEAASTAGGSGWALLRNTLLAVGSLVLVAAALVVWIIRKPARG